MMKMALRLWHDERGFVQSAELVLIGTIVILGAIVGLASLRDGIVSELDDTGKAVGALNQSFSVNITGGCADCGPNVNIDVEGNTVTVTQTLNLITTESTFRNFNFNDAADFCEATAITHPAPGGNEGTPAPTPVP